MKIIFAIAAIYAAIIIVCYFIEPNPNPPIPNPLTTKEDCLLFEAAPAYELRRWEKIARGENCVEIDGAAQN